MKGKFLRETSVVRKGHVQCIDVRVIFISCVTLRLGIHMCGVVQQFGRQKNGYTHVVHCGPPLLCRIICMDSFQIKDIVAIFCLPHFYTAPHIQISSFIVVP